MLHLQTPPSSVKEGNQNFELLFLRGLGQGIAVLGQFCA